MPDALLLPLQALAFVAAFLLPGAAWTWHHDPARPLEVRLAVGAAVGLLVVPMASFCAAWLLGTNVRAPLVLAVGALVAAPGLALALLRRRRPPKPLSGGATRPRRHPAPPPPGPAAPSPDSPPPTLPSGPRGCKSASDAARERPVAAGVRT